MWRLSYVGWSKHISANLYKQMYKYSSPSFPSYSHTNTIDSLCFKDQEEEYL